MSLGDYFPPEYRQQVIRQSLAPGRVIRLHCDFAGKEKYLLLACMRSDPLFFVINSRMNRFVQAREHQRKCQVLIDCGGHDFLHHDSYINCTETKPIALLDIQRQIHGDLSRIKGVISNGVRDQVVAAVKFARTLSPKEKRLIIAAFGQ